MTIDELYKIIKDRQLRMPEGSYVASLFQAGQDKIIQKVGEETSEVIIAAKNKDKQRTISEIADLWFHILVIMASLNIKPKNILNELEKRKK